MRGVVEKSFLDWSRDKNQRIRAKGIAAILTQKLKSDGSSSISTSTRCVWPSSTSKNDSRYLSRRIWLS